MKRFVSIWFRYLKTDWYTLRNPHLKNVAFVLASPINRRMVITAVNYHAEIEGIFPGMVVADARAIFSSLEVLPDQPELEIKLLEKLARWSIRFTPITSADIPGGLAFDATGCCHLWGNERNYLELIQHRFHLHGYTTQLAISDTLGSAWAFSRFGSTLTVSPSGQHKALMENFPIASLQTDPAINELLIKLGLSQVGDLYSFPKSILQSRLGDAFIVRWEQVIGEREEYIVPIVPVPAFIERLSSPEPISTRNGVDHALKHLLNALLVQLHKKELGIRKCIFILYRTDARLISLEIASSRPSINFNHLYKLFELQFDKLATEPGIELFTLEASATEALQPCQELLWVDNSRTPIVKLSQLIDHIKGKFGNNCVKRFLPSEHFWPERSFQPSDSLYDEHVLEWKVEKPRPIRLLTHPVSIDVTAPIPDYPPMLFRYQKKLHKIVKADGPERIEQEWWLTSGKHRDYYYVEDEDGNRYWLFRLGHYTGDKSQQWFLHGFFA